MFLIYSQNNLAQYMRSLFFINNSFGIARNISFIYIARNISIWITLIGLFSKLFIIFRPLTIIGRYPWQLKNLILILP